MATRIVQHVTASSDYFWELDDVDIDAALAMEGSIDDKFEYLNRRAVSASVSSTDDVDYVLVRDGWNNEEGWRDFVAAVNEEE